MRDNSERQQWRDITPFELRIIIKEVLRAGPLDHLCRVAASLLLRIIGVSSSYSATSSGFTRSQGSMARKQDYIELGLCLGQVCIAFKLRVDQGGRDQTVCSVRDELSR